MGDKLPPPGPIDLDRLDDYLMSDRAPDDSMGLSDLDGFLTGIVVGPEMILPSEWLPVIWGGEAPEFETEDEMRTVLGTIMGRYNEIVTCFNNGADEFDPIFWKGPEGDVIVTDWAGGFLDAVALRPEAWKPLVDDDDAWKLMVPLQWLNGDLGFENKAAEDAFLSEAPNVIPVCIRGIHGFWTSRNRSAVVIGVAGSRRRTNGQGRRRG